MSDNAIVIRPEFAPGRRIIAISDIHGNLPFLQNLLRKIHFTKEDILILLGDMLEKGPDNLALASYIMDLCNTHTVYPICGNCDGLVLNFFRTDALDESFFARYLPNHPESCIFQMADRMGYTGDRWDFPALRSALNRGFPHLRDWLATLPTILETEHLVFVHGGVPSLEHMEQFNRWKCMKNDNFRGQGHSFDKYVIVGHWPVTLYHEDIPSAAPIFDWEQKIISIDGGCVLKIDGQLNALILPHVIHFNAADGTAAEKYGRLARLCGLAANPRSLAAGLNRLRAQLKLPERLSACGVEGKELTAALDGLAEAAQADLCAPSNPRPAAAEDLKSLLRELA